MYRSVDEALKAAYRLAGLRIEPQNNTQQICRWMLHRGVTGGGSGMTQHEWHANGAMLRARVERILPLAELAAVEAQYGANLSRIVDLTLCITAQYPQLDPLLCDALVAHVFTGRPRRVDIMDKYDLSNGRFYRRYKLVSGSLAAMLGNAVMRLEPEFVAAGIILKEEVLV